MSADGSSNWQTVLQMGNGDGVPRWSSQEIATNNTLGGYYYRACVQGDGVTLNAGDSPYSAVLDNHLG